MNNALEALEAFDQFILYRAQPSASRPGKTDKVPCTAYWCAPTAARAAAAASNKTARTGG